jgi:hypothetical protein
VPGADLYDRLSLGRGTGQNYGCRQAAQHGQSVTFVGLKLIPVDDQTIDPDNGP